MEESNVRLDKAVDMSVSTKPVVLLDSAHSAESIRSKIDQLSKERGFNVMVYPLQGSNLSYFSRKIKADDEVWVILQSFHLAEANLVEKVLDIFNPN